MKTWEMLKELSENPKSKYQMKKREYKYEMALSEFNYLILNAFYNNNLIGTLHGKGNFNGNIKLDDEWELVQEQVDFMTAINSRKPIRYETWENYHDFDATLTLLQVRPKAMALEWINGKWYIEQ